MVLVAVLVASCSSGGVPQTDQKAPDFELYDTGGQAVRLSDYLGHPVAVNFWGTNCTYCVQEMPLLQQAYEQESAKDDGVVILTVNVQDSALGTRTFLAQNDYTLPGLVDSGGRVAQAYGVSAIPITFLIDRDGVVRYVKRGMFLSLNEVNAAFDRVR
jgi:peroxiredoxin